jgi:ribosomal protein S26
VQLGVAVAVSLEKATIFENFKINTQHKFLQNTPKTCPVSKEIAQQTSRNERRFRVNATDYAVSVGNISA